MVLGYASELEENTTSQRNKGGKRVLYGKQAEKLRSLVNDLNLVSMLEYEMQPLNKKADSTISIG